MEAMQPSQPPSPRSSERFWDDGGRGRLTFPGSRRLDGRAKPSSLLKKGGKSSPSDPYTFEKVDDQPMSETERWLEMALPGTQTHIMLGLRGQSGGSSTGMTGFVLHTDTIEETCATLKARGVTLTQELTTEPWGKWAQFTDLDNNEFGIWAPAW